MDTPYISSYPAATLLNTHVRTISAKQVGVDYAISRWLLASCVSGEKTYPVLYILDSNSGFGMAADLTHILAAGPDVPELIIVGIGNYVASYAEWVTQRNRDYTPTPNSEQPGEGGAPQFLEFVDTELIPLIDAKYRTDPTDRALWGYSLAGTFVLHALLKRPTLFHRYIAGSPNVGIPDRVMFQYEMDLAQGRSVLPVKLAITVGEFASNFMSPMDEWWSHYRPRIEEFWTLLRSRNYEGLDLKTLVIAGETHVSGVASAYTRGLRAVFS